MVRAVASSRMSNSAKSSSSLIDQKPASHSHWPAAFKRDTQNPPVERLFFCSITLLTFAGFYQPTSDFLQKEGRPKRMVMATSLWTPSFHLKLDEGEPLKLNAKSKSASISSFARYRHLPVVRCRKSLFGSRIYCKTDHYGNKERESNGIQLYTQIERLLTETVKQSQDGWWGSEGWNEVEGSWILKPKASKPKFVVHFVGGIFVGAAPQLTYRWFLERLADKGILIIATPYASGFDHFVIADEVQFKFDRCYRLLQETIRDLPTFGVGHSLGSVVHLLIGSRYAVQRCGNVLMAFNNKEASSAVPLFSPVLVPVAQSIGPLLSDIVLSPTIRAGAEMTFKQLENVSPSIMKQVLPLVEQLPPLYMDLVNGREDFTPKPDETRRLIKSYYGISRNLLIKFKDDFIDETSMLAQVLSSESAVSSELDMSIRKLPGDHGLPLQQAIPDFPPVMADAVNRGSELLANLAIGTPWETVAKEVGNTLGMDSKVLRADISKDMNLLVDVISSWMASNAGPKLLRPG